MCLFRSHLVTALRGFDIYQQKEMGRPRLSILDLPIIALGAFVGTFFDVSVAEMLGECSGRRARHIAHGAFDAIDMRVHVIVEQLLGGVALEALAALEIV